MTKIKDVTIEFSCPQTLDSKLHCDRCSHTVIDFTSKSERALRQEINKSKGPVCGIFKKSQLSDQFLKYAAATFIATSLAVPTLGQEVIKGDLLLKACEKMETENEEEVFFGMIVETQAEPLGGYKKFFEAIASKMNYPTGLKEKGKSFVEFTIDSLGQMKDVRLIKGFNKLADKEAVRVLSTLNYPFKPGRQRGKFVKTRLVIPIKFDPESDEKR
ncbi:MAG TPA: energy transducer TonB [Ohtaekwangia sp.]|nr:energy transducer TonB [Ohtaekwangia sp.]